MEQVSAPLSALRDVLRSAPLDLDLATAAAGRVTRDELVDQITDYLLPRLARIDAPLLAVVGGSTGAGKSTLVNSLAGATVSEPGVLRPTTRAPVLVCHPDDLAAFDADRSHVVLPDLPRLRGGEQTGGLRVAASSGIPAGVALLDTPDIDSVELAHHDLAVQLLGAADLWLFVTTAARYADAVPWDHLARARERAVELAVIVNRVPPDAGDVVTEHLVAMLRDRGLGSTPVFTIPEEPLTDGRIGPSIGLLQAWLTGLAADEDTRRRVVRRSLEGALASVPERVERVAAAVADQARAVDHLRREVQRRFDDARERIRAELATGSLLRDQVLERFREHIGTADWMDRLQRTVGRVRDRLRAAVTGTPAPEVEVRGAIEQHLVDLVRHSADEAALQTVDAWRSLPGGADVLDGVAAGFDRASPDLEADAARAVASWQSSVLQLVRERAGGKMALARGLSLGVNSVGVALMVVVFAQTGGITGGEAAVAGGTAAVSQALLSAVFGEQAVRDLARRARDDLLERMDTLLAAEEARLVAALDGLAATADEQAVREALAVLARARS